MSDVKPKRKKSEDDLDAMIIIKSPILEKQKDILEENKGRYAIQGETYGPKIANNPLDSKELKFVILSLNNFS